MKVTYYAYAFKHVTKDKRGLCDLSSFLRSFSQLKDKSFKNGFIYNDENIYLVHYVDNIYFFIITRNSEIIRRINSNTFAVGDMQAILGQDDHIGFASYIIVNKDHIGFGSTIFAPKAEAFGWYVNEILSKIGISDLQFYMHAIMHSATKSDALTFPYIGRTVIEVDKSHPALVEFVESLGFDVTDSIDLGSMEIHIKPKPRKEITNAAHNIVKNISDDGLVKFMMRAQAEVGSQVQDMYLVGSGAVAI
ncbi:hypothetical protein Q427_01760 [Halomonas sp. BC04]|nr:hypothetical protein Q427_01760 [Halomonas sp. BC04]